MPLLIDLDLDIPVIEDEKHVRTLETATTWDSAVPHDLMRLARQLRQSAADFGKNIVLLANLHSCLLGLHRDEAAPADRHVTDMIARILWRVVDGTSG